MDPRWWFRAICEYDRLGLDMRVDDYDAYLAGPCSMDCTTETAMTA